MYIPTIPGDIKKDWNKISSVIVYTNPTQYRPVFLIWPNFKNSSKIQILEYIGNFTNIAPIQNINYMDIL